MVMDVFAACIPEERLRRVHFADFMLGVHRRLHRQRREGAGPEALRNVAAEVAARPVLCLDEMAV